MYLYVRKRIKKWLWRKKLGQIKQFRKKLKTKYCKVFIQKVTDVRE